MVNDLFEVLSAEQRDRARSTVVATFGSASVDAVTPITGGASGACPVCIEVGGRCYLLRLEGPASPLRNPHQYVSMRIAAEAGLAPRIHYVDEANRVAVTDFIERRPLRNYPGGPLALAKALGALLRRLQEAPLFPWFVDYPDIVARLFAHVRRTGLFAAGLLDAHVERLEHVRDAYAASPPMMVASHNDPVPGNILFDGARLWLIDWESAYRNDPLVDVAIVLDVFARTPELEAELLRAWLGRAADETVHARLELVRALTRLYYAGVMFSASALAPRIAPDADLAALAPAALEHAIRDGRLKLGTAQTKHILGKMFLASFHTGVAPPGFDFAVANTEETWVNQASG